MGLFYFIQKLLVLLTRPFIKQGSYKKFSCIKYKSKVRNGMSLVEMALVILIVGILMSLVLTMVRYAVSFRDAESEAKKLASILEFSKNAAMTSNETIQLEIDMKNQKYKGYRATRASEGRGAKEIIPEVKLGESYSIMGIRISQGSLQKEGTFSLRFSPTGLSDEVSIYFGPKHGRIEWTVYLSRYSGSALIEKGEMIHNLEDPNWEERSLLQ